MPATTAATFDDLVASHPGGSLRPQLYQLRRGPEDPPERPIPCSLSPAGAAGALARACGDPARS